LRALKHVASAASLSRRLLAAAAFGVIRTKASKGERRAASPRPLASCER
jgi:hypothetical protein